jgi:hypothetical protein
MARAPIRTVEASAPPLFQGLVARASAIGSHHLYQRLPRSQRTSLGLVHVENVAQLCGPSPTPELLWKWAGGLLTWSYVANKMGVGVPELDLQLQLSTTLIRRFAATRVVQLRVEEKALAKRGAPICDALAAEVTVALALEAAEWSEWQIERITASAEAGSEITLKRSPAQEAA